MLCESCLEESTPVLCPVIRPSISKIQVTTREKLHDLLLKLKGEEIVLVEPLPFSEAELFKAETFSGSMYK